jgi:hypothetical protein
MKKLLIASVIATTAVAAPAHNLFNVLVGGMVIGAVVASNASSTQPVPASVVWQGNPGYTPPQPVAVAPTAVYQPAQVQQVAIVPVQAVASPVENDPRKEYLRECQRYGFRLDSCKQIWDGRAIETEAPPQVAVMTFTHQPQPKVLDVDNQEYKQRREEALKKPNSFVEQVTLP